MTDLINAGELHDWFAVSVGTLLCRPNDQVVVDILQRASESSREGVALRRSEPADHTHLMFARIRLRLAIHSTKFAAPYIRTKGVLLW